MKNKKYKNLDVIFLLILINCIPYCIIGEGLSGMILFLVSTIFILIKKYKVFIDKYIILMFFMSILGLILLKQSNNIFLSIEGIYNYLIFISFYYIFYNLKDRKQQIYNFYVYIFTMISIISILYQGIFLNQRISGNIGYANTYGLLILITIYINCIKENKKFKQEIEVILMVAILYTQSRTSIILLFVYVIAMIIMKFKFNSKNYTICNITLSIITYVITVKMGILALIIILPIILIVIYIFKYKINMVSVVLAFSSIYIMTSSNMNIFNRIRNISIKTPVLQERFIYYTDVLNAILHNPLGFGVNTFLYKQYGIQTAFYDVKYIHNSILQFTFDLGIIGAIVFIFISICILIQICKRTKGEKRILYILMYLSIYFHSMLDFDFSFPMIFIGLSMIVGFLETHIYNFNDIVKYLIISISVVCVYFITANLLLFIGNIGENHNDYDLAKQMYTINKYITFRKNPDTYVLLAQVSDDEEKIYYLKKAEKLNENDPKISANLAFTYEKKDEPYKAVIYYDKFFNNEKFCKEMYDTYFEFLKISYFKTKDKFFQNKIVELKDIYKSNLQKLSSRSIYLKDQLK